MFTINIEVLGFSKEKELFNKYLYIPVDNLLLELYHLTFKNLLLDYEIFMNFHTNIPQEINHSAYKFGEIINSSYVVLNNFLVQIYFYLVNEKKLNLNIEDEENNFDKIFGSYETGKGKGKDSKGNKNNLLLKRISSILEIDFAE